MKKIERKDVKTAAKFVVGMSVGFVVSNVIKNNTTAEKPHHKVEAAIGGFVIGAMAADYAERWTSKQIDLLATEIEQAKQKNQTKK